MIIQQFLLHPETLVALLNLAVAATLACGIGLVAECFCRKQSVPFRYGLLLSALLLALFSPLFVVAGQQWGLGIIQVSVSDSRNDGQSLSPELMQTHLSSRPDSNSWFTEIVGDEEIGMTMTSTNLDFTDAASERHSSESISAGMSWWQLLGTTIAMVWIIGSIIKLGLLAQGWHSVRKLHRSLKHIHGSRSQRAGALAARVFHLKQVPPVLESSLTPVPLSMGLFRPVIVQPEGLERELNDEQLQAVLLHETAHIAHKHHWGGLAQRIVAVLFWWNPLLHRMNYWLSELREDICDSYVVVRQGSGYTFAQVLVEFAARTTPDYRPAFAIGLLENHAEGLEGRIKRLLDEKRTTTTRLSFAATAAVGAFTIAVGCLLLASNVLADGEQPSSDSAQNESTTTISSKNIVIVKVNTREELQRAVTAAKPGTKILIAAGTYQGGLAFNKVQGAKDRPIIIAAEDPKRRPVFEGGNSSFHFSNPAYLELHSLVLTKAKANGLNIDDGGTFDTPAHHIVLKGLEIKDIGSDRNHDAIKLSGVDNFRVENSVLQRWGGKGSAIDMVGCHRGTISGCHFLEGDKIYANAVQAKGGSSDITISRCRFIDAGGRAINIGGSTGLKYFRPKPQGYEAKNITVEDCTFIGSMAPVSFVGVDGATFHHNTIYRPTRWVMRILQENQHPEFVSSRNGKFNNNIIAFRSDELAYAVNVGQKTAPATFTFQDNFWYCIDRPEKTRKSIQLPSDESNGKYGQAPMFQNAERGDLRLQQQSPVQNAGVRPL